MNWVLSLITWNWDVISTEAHRNQFWKEKERRGRKWGRGRTNNAAGMQEAVQGW